MLPFRISRFISRPSITNQVIRRLSMGASQDPIVKALEPFSTCDVSDALLKLKYPNGGFLSNLTLWSPERQTGSTKIAGPAFTVKYVLLSDTESPKFSGHYIDTIPSGSVVFISCPPRVVNAVYGGLMSNRAQYLGAVGTIVDGRVRDLQEHRDLGYPVFARDIGTTSPSEVVRVSSTNTAVKLHTEDQDATINPGDYLIGDISGVVCLPKDLAEKAISLMQPQVEADLKMAADIQKGMSFVEASKLHRSGLPKA